MSYGASAEQKTYGLVAEFESAERLLDAAERARLEGYRKMDAYTPFPVHGLSEAIGFRDIKVPWMVFAAGLTGAFCGYSLQWYTLVYDYPLNVGGKPLNSLPSFMPITFECTILFAALTAFFGQFALNGLPMYYHSIFNTPGFDRCSQDRFFLAIEAEDKNFDLQKTKDFLSNLNPLSLNEVDE